MYDNIGEKIKGLAKATFIVEAIASVITGIALWIETEEWWCALILFCGPIVAWVSSWLLYGFGEIIDKLCDIEQNTRGGQSKSQIREISQKAEEEAAEKAKREAEEKAKIEAAERAKREAMERARREAEEEKTKQEIEAKAKREAEEKAKKEADAIAKKEAEERTKQGIATTVKLNRFGEVLCPVCQKNIECENTGTTKCPSCGCLLKVIR